MSNPIGFTFDKKVFCSRNTPHFVFAEGPASAAWTASRLFALSILKLISRMRKTASWAFASSALSKSLLTTRGLHGRYGRATTVAKLDNAGVNGTYLTSEGKKGRCRWGTRGRWCISAVSSARARHHSHARPLRQSPASPPTGMPAATASSAANRSARKFSAMARKS